MYRSHAESKPGLGAPLARREIIALICIYKRVLGLHEKTFGAMGGSKNGNVGKKFRCPRR